MFNSRGHGSIATEWCTVEKLHFSSSGSECATHSSHLRGNCRPICPPTEWPWRDDVGSFANDQLVVAGDTDEMMRQEATSDGSDGDGCKLLAANMSKMKFPVISKKEVTHRVMRQGHRFHGSAATRCSSSLHSVFPSYFLNSGSSGSKGEIRPATCINRDYQWGRLVNCVRENKD